MLKMLSRFFGIGKWLAGKPSTKTRSEHWRKVRQDYLAKHPLCAACGSNKRLEVHHIKPFHLNPELELREDNLITLCESRMGGSRNCHYTFGHAYNWKGFNPYVEKDAAEFAKRVQGSTKLAKS